MAIEQKINQILNSNPKVKKLIKRIYQKSMYLFSKKIKFEGDIFRITPDDEFEYFFGYYDKSPWDKNNKYLICMRAKNTWADVSPREKADILLIDTELPLDHINRVKKISETSTWNVQQGSMLQWLGPNFDSKIIFNDIRNGKYCAIILDINNMVEEIIDFPIYSVSNDGQIALSLDFSRLYELRPGYGYYNIEEKTKGEELPDSPAIWKIDLGNNLVEPLLYYKDFYNFKPRKEMKKSGTFHKVNHIMISPNNDKFMVLYRWINNKKKYTRLITCNVNGEDMYLLSDDDMVSHCFWKNNDEIIAFENKHNSGPGYYLMKDKTNKYTHCWPSINTDGHPSYSPNKKWIITDTYPDRSRIQRLMLMKSEKDSNVKTIAKVFSPFRYDNDTRCDLHPRWSRDSKKVCFDATFEGKRGIYFVNI